MSDAPRLVALQRTLYASRNPTRRYLHNARRQWVQAQLRDSAGVELALELGPGSGVYLPTLRGVARRVLAVDAEVAYLRAARELLYSGHPVVVQDKTEDTLEDKGSSKDQDKDTDTDTDKAEAGIEFVQGDLRAPPLREGSVDLLLCSEVIEHVPAPDSGALIRGMAGLLSPRGRLILTTPQPFSPIELLGKIAFLPGIIHLLRALYREPVEPTGHINLLGRGQLARQIEAAGLRVIQSAELGLYLPLIAEFGGAPGQRLLAGLDRRLRGTALRGLLWTQCYVLERAR